MIVPRPANLKLRLQFTLSSIETFQHHALLHFTFSNALYETTEVPPIKVTLGEAQRLTPGAVYVFDGREVVR